MVKENLNSINLLKEALEVVHSEIFDIQKENEDLKSKNEANLKRISELDDRLNNQDRYCRRWNLRLEGLTECAEDNVKARVMEICKEVVVEEDCNFVATRDLTWKGAKGNDFLKKNKMYFKEDLTIKDRAAQNLLWPSIDKARKEGKRAFFVGIKAIVDGKEIKS
ncbi:Orotidine 5'-phosphate decarboxylase [Labeo rohita]|uniref:Orotidine 5'-phosphate decarboxylase n=1 Tax=Labeo rohita TaxID=84645 RepID=A0ABQ8M047_LABRO|nr:Orotidine 5'-phosphate decarboxylase [Labeo rohita]